MSSNEPVKNGCEVIHEMFHILNCGFEIYETFHISLQNQEIPVTAQNLIITTPRTSCIYFKPKIHKPNNPGHPIVSACSCLTELISKVCLL